MPSVLLIRPTSSGDLDQQVFRDLGFEVTVDPYLEVQPSNDEGVHERVSSLFTSLATPGSWFILTSANGVKAIEAIVSREILAANLLAAQETGSRFATVGPTSAHVLTNLGISDVLYPEKIHTAVELVNLLSSREPSLAVIPCSNIAGRHLSRSLTLRGWTTDEQVVYETRTLSNEPPTVPKVQKGEFDCIIVRSPSAARALNQFCAQIPLSTRVIATGPTTAEALENLGIAVALVTSGTSAFDVAQCAAQVLSHQDTK